MIISYKIYHEFFYQYIKNIYYSLFKKNNLLIQHPIANQQEYLKIHNEYKKKYFKVIEDYEIQCGSKIQKKWLDEMALHTQIVIKKSNICYEHGKILYSTLCIYLKNFNQNQYIQILETGTARGFSALCMAKALKDHNIKGNIKTIDLIPHNKKMFWNCIDDHECKKTRSELLKNWTDLCSEYITFLTGNTRKIIKNLNRTRINFAFLDASHTYFDIVKEFSSIYPLQHKNDIVVFDDYSKNKFYGLYVGINYLCKKYNYEKKIIKINDDRAYVIATKK